MDKLELLALAKDFTVKKLDTNYYPENSYRVSMNAEYDYDDNPLEAVIINENGESRISYYVTGCYNSGCDNIEIVLNELEKLKKFCELMIAK